MTVCLFHGARALILWIMHLCMEELVMFFKWLLCSNTYNAVLKLYKAIIYMSILQVNIYAGGGREIGY